MPFEDSFNREMGVLIELDPSSGFRSNRPTRGTTNNFPCDRFIPPRSNSQHGNMNILKWMSNTGNTSISSSNSILREDNNQSGFNTSRNTSSDLFGFQNSQGRLFGGNDENYDNSNNNESLMGRLLAETLDSGNQANKLISFKKKVDPSRSLQESIAEVFSKGGSFLQARKGTRTLPQGPERILDAPELIDDYYLNLLDWGDNNLLAVSLGRCVYLWNPISGDIQQLLESPEPMNYVTSVSWMPRGNCLSVGFANNVIQLWDVEKFQGIRNIYGHQARVSSLAWNNHMLSSGGRDSVVINHDIRVANHIISRNEGHEQEICGLKWSPDGKQLASGGNDNMLLIWDIGVNTPRYIHRDHVAAVKALAWCPWQRHLLASGGGTADKTIKFWSTDTGSMIKSVNAESQVCSLIWNKYDKELLSAHGFSKNQLSLWKFPSMAKIGEMKGHTDRVLHMTASPNCSTVVSAAADETLRFWKIFDVPYEECTKKQPKTLLSGIHLR